MYGSGVFVNVSSCGQDSASRSSLRDGIELSGCVCEFVFFSGVSPYLFYMVVFGLDKVYDCWFMFGV